jgi:hypothetical protein
VLEIIPEKLESTLTETALSEIQKGISIFNGGFLNGVFR